MPYCISCGRQIDEINAECARCRGEVEPPATMKVEVTDFDLPIDRMVVFILKWTFGFHTGGNHPRHRWGDRLRVHPHNARILMLFYLSASIHPQPPAIADLLACRLPCCRRSDSIRDRLLPVHDCGQCPRHGLRRPERSCGGEAVLGRNCWRRNFYAGESRTGAVLLGVAATGIGAGYFFTRRANEIEMCRNEV